MKTDDTACAAAAPSPTSVPSRTKIESDVISSSKKQPLPGKTIHFGGAGPFVSIIMSQNMLTVQQKVSDNREFELYIKVFFKSLVGYPGVVEHFDTNREVYDNYVSHYHDYYSDTQDGGWGSILSTIDVIELRCHLSWVLGINIFVHTDWTSKSLLKEQCDKMYHQRLFTYLEGSNKFAHYYYVRKSMSALPDVTLFQWYVDHCQM